MLTVMVIGSVLAIGTVHFTVLAVVSAVAFAAAAVSLYRSARAPQGLSIPLPALVFAALAGYTLLQAIPMPIGWLRIIAPANADVWDAQPRSRSASRPRRGRRISLDPGASRRRGAQMDRLRRPSSRASAAVSAQARRVVGRRLVFARRVLAAVTTLGHGLARGDQGLWRSTSRTSSRSVWHIGPLLNPNNLAGYLNLGALAASACCSPAADPACVAGRRGVMLIVGVDVTSASRAGVLALPHRRHGASASSRGGRRRAAGRRRQQRVDAG